MTKIDAFKAPEKQRYIGKRRSGSKSRKNDHEAKTYRFESHLGAILASSWGTWEAFRGHFGRLGANLSQHKAILSHLGANLWSSSANMTPTRANMSQHRAAGTPLDGSKKFRHLSTMPQLSHSEATAQQLLAPGPPRGRTIGGGKPLLNYSTVI